MYPKDYLQIIYKICEKHNISIREFDSTSVLRLIYNNEQHFIWSRRFDLNSAISSRLADNKYEMFKVLSSCGIPVVSCNKLFRVGTEEYINNYDSNFHICEKFLKQYKAIVIKPNNSYEGKNVFKCTSLKEIETALCTIDCSHKFMVVSPYIEAVHEYRTIFLHGTILLAYKKEMPYVIADGESTLLDLLVAQSYSFDNIDCKLYQELNQVYPVGKKIPLNWKFNLTQGARCQIVDEPNLYTRLSLIAAAAANAIGISFASVDILEDNDGNLNVLEINAGVAMDQFIQQTPLGREIATSIYEKAILTMFHIK